MAHQPQINNPSIKNTIISDTTDSLSRALRPAIPCSKYFIPFHAILIEAIESHQLEPFPTYIAIPPSEPICDDELPTPLLDNLIGS